jgi:hypothetical protein
MARTVARVSSAMGVSLFQPSLDEWLILRFAGYFDSNKPFAPCQVREIGPSGSAGSSIKALQAYLASETNDDAEGAYKSRASAHNNSGHSCRLRTKIRSTSINLETLWSSARHFRGAGLVAKLNGTSAVLLLDTGASGILVNGKVAEKAGIKRVVQTDIKGIGDKGSASGFVGFADKVYRADPVKLQFSHFRHDREDLVSFDMSQVSNDTGTEIAGILGYAMLRLLDVKIDYRDGLVDFQFDPDRFH